MAQLGGPHTTPTRVTKPERMKGHAESRYSVVCMWEFSYISLEERHRETFHVVYRHVNSLAKALTFISHTLKTYIWLASP